MRNLLRYEFHKLFQARVLYICAGVLVLVVVLFAGINKMEEVVMEEAISEFALGEEPLEFHTGDEMPDGLASIMGFNGNHSGASDLLQVMTNIYLIVIFAAFTAVLCCGDYGNGTIKNVITKGYSRTEIFFSKYIVGLTVSLGYTLLAMLTAFLCGTFLWKVGNTWSLRFIPLILLQFLAVAAYNALFCFLAALLKRTGPVLIVSIAVPLALPMILTLVDLFTEGAVTSSEYWLSGCISQVSSIRASGAGMAKSALWSVVYGVLFTAGGWFFNRKREV